MRRGTAPPCPYGNVDFGTSSPCVGHGADGVGEKRQALRQPDDDHQGRQDQPSDATAKSLHAALPWRRGAAVQRQHYDK